MKKTICVLMVMIFFVDAKQTRRMRDVETLLKRSGAQPTPATQKTPINVDKEVIIKKLDEQLQSPVANAWDDRVNDLFDLAMVDRELARQYFVKMRDAMAVTDVKPVEVVVEKPGTNPVETKPVTPVEEKLSETMLPAGEEPMKKAVGRSAPPRKPGALKVEPTEVPKTEENPTGEEPMKKGSAPAPKKGAPRGGPAKNIGGAKKPGMAEPGTAKEVASKTPEQIFSKAKLEQLDNDKLVELFNELLEKLGTVSTNWNGMAVEKVEEKTKYGSKIYNVYGVPVSDWTRKIDTLRDVLGSKNVMTKEESKQKKDDRIAQVRAEKIAAKPAVSAQSESEDRPKEEMTEDDLVRAIKAQLVDPKPTDIGWAVSIKGNIKALDKLNHATAIIYHDQFIKITKEKSFLK